MAWPGVRAITRGRPFPSTRAWVLVVRPPRERPFAWSSGSSLRPQPSDQIAHRLRKGSRGGRPVNFDAHDYKHRNVVERAFNHFKNWRGLATRYDKHALVYRGGVVLAAIMLWLT